jgi:hypothetical protein
MTTTEILLSAIACLWSVVFVCGCFWLRRISDKIDRLYEHRENCVRDFADRSRNDAAHKEFYDRIAVHDRDISNIVTRLSRLEP